MNRTELLNVFDGIEPTDKQKEKMLIQVLSSNEINPSKKSSTSYSKTLKIAAAFTLVLIISGTTAYATGILDKVLGHFTIKDNWISWATDESILDYSNNADKVITEKKNDEVYSYETVEKALQSHPMNIAIPNVESLTYDKNDVSVNISHDTPNLIQTKFRTNYHFLDGTVELDVTCYAKNSDAKSGISMHISTSQHADKASKYISKSGTTYTILKSSINGKKQTVANVMIKPDDNQTYFYSILFTDVKKSDIETILDSLDMSIYVTD